MPSSDLLNCEVIAEKRTPTLTGLGAVAALFCIGGGAGVAVFAGVGLVALGLRWPVRVPVVGAGVAVLAVFAWWLAKTERLLWITETIRQTVPAKAPALDVPHVRVEISEPDARRMAFLNLPGTPEQLTTLARGLLLGRPFSEAEWSGGGRPYTRAEFRELRAQLIERGVCRWRDGGPSQGVEMTRAGVAVMERIAEVPALLDDARTRARVHPAAHFSTGTELE
jgi:hypothetical protein